MKPNSQYPLSDAVEAASTYKLGDMFREPDGSWNRPLIAVSALALLLTLGHFVYPASSMQQIAAATIVHTNAADLV